MENTNYRDIIRKVRKKELLSIYLLHGEEAFFIDEIVQVIEENILSEAEKAFNLSVLYGRDIDAKIVLDHARQYPMMAEKRVVIIKEAQFMRDLKDLEPYLISPSPHTILVFAHKKKIDSRIKWVKHAKKSKDVVFFTSNSVPDYKITNWITGYINEEGHTISPDAAEMLSQHLGNDLKKIINEFEKIKLNISDRDIDVSIIEKFVGVSRDYDIFELLRALAKNNLSRVHTIQDNLEKNEKVQPLQKILPAMASYFERVLIVAQHANKNNKELASIIGTYPNFIQEYRDMAQSFGFEGLIKTYHLIVEADGMSKGLNRRNSSGVLKELIGKMILLKNQLSYTMA